MFEQPFYMYVHIMYMTYLVLNKKRTFRSKVAMAGCNSLSDHIRLHSFTPFCTHILRKFRCISFHGQNVPVHNQKEARVEARPLFSACGATFKNNETEEGKKEREIQKMNSSVSLSQGRFQGERALPTQKKKGKTLPSLYLL